MYASEKYVRLEVRELLSKINESSSDLGADIKYLFSLIEGMQLQIKELQERVDRDS